MTGRKWKTGREVCNILSNYKIGEKIYQMKVETNRKISNLDETASECLSKIVDPGNYIWVRPDNQPRPMLARPMSVHSTNRKNAISIIYKIKAAGSTNPTGTQLLSHMKTGDNIEIVGPSGGNLFTIDNNINKIALIGGGVGVSPLSFLAEEYHKLNKDIHIFAGFANKKEIICERKLEKISDYFNLATTDGSKGYHGNIIDAFAESTYDDFNMIFACGPKKMYQALKKLNIKTPTEVSVEKRGACYGTGCCHGCGLSVKEGNKKVYKRVCTDGPIFNLKDMILE
ncbi:MAG: hypothetical protein KJ697_03740 [Nanoarchaeota archaeon]|nr:hypothetical protein [Nanoarchaeota archaeon]MBU4124567.1 hypothetical protein [Nanoarchaeota archaeon]